MNAAKNWSTNWKTRDVQNRWMKQVTYQDDLTTEMEPCGQSCVHLRRQILRLGEGRLQFSKLAGCKSRSHSTLPTTLTTCKLWRHLKIIRVAPHVRHFVTASPRFTIHWRRWRHYRRWYLTATMAWRVSPKVLTGLHRRRMLQQQLTSHSAGYI